MVSGRLSVAIGDLVLEPKSHSLTVLSKAPDAIQFSSRLKICSNVSTCKLMAYAIQYHTSVPGNEHNRNENLLSMDLLELWHGDSKLSMYRRTTQK